MTHSCMKRDEYEMIHSEKLTQIIQIHTAQVCLGICQCPLHICAAVFFQMETVNSFTPHAFVCVSIWSTHIHDLCCSFSVWLTKFLWSSKRRRNESFFLSVIGLPKLHVCRNNWQIETQTSWFIFFLFFLCDVNRMWGLEEEEEEKTSGFVIKEILNDLLPSLAINTI